MHIAWFYRSVRLKSKKYIITATTIHLAQTGMWRRDRSEENSQKERPGEYRETDRPVGGQTDRPEEVRQVFGRQTPSLTRNLRFCFQWEPWALVWRWASVTIRIRSHSELVGSGRFCRVFTISSFFRRSRFSSMRRRLATRFESSSTTDGERDRGRNIVTHDEREAGNQRETGRDRRQMRWTERAYGCFYWHRNGEAKGTLLPPFYLPCIPTNSLMLQHLRLNDIACIPVHYNTLGKIKHTPIKRYSRHILI